jgi:hypothetical protein
MFYPVLLLAIVAASFFGAWFAVLGTRWSAAFDASYWTVFSATLLAYAGTMVMALVLSLTGLASVFGPNTLLAILPLSLLLITAVLYGLMIRYPKGGGAVGLSLGIRVAIVQLGLTALTGVAVVAGTQWLS